MIYNKIIRLIFFFKRKKASKKELFYAKLPNKNNIFLFIFTMNKNFLYLLHLY